MKASGAAATCAPVRIDDQDWETALFVHLAGPECKGDRALVARPGRSVPVGMETDLIETDNAAVVLLRLEVHTVADDPLQLEVLLTPGQGGSHFESLKLLSTQPRLRWFFGDDDYCVLRTQEHPLDDDSHAAFDELLRDAVAHDAMIRCTGRYDAMAALQHVVSHYALRDAGAVPPPMRDAGH